ncbi:MAG: hypothetical protein HQK88_01270 [Nitrospirae bacterium]|nr:hypothetical protein [Nitrospirota bacterium]MBF0533865.1 hypothetical protein [Nitrospirota bacterium]MBF0615426.1 hypothetical protein [Nitrospirota bacterium]
MKTSFYDKQTLLALKPLEIIAYLRSKGWQQSKINTGKWTTWVKDGDFEAILPLNREFGDFALRMADILKTLEAVEERSQLEIVNDLLTSSADIIRLHIKDAESDDGTISIEAGAQIIKSSCDLIIAGACAAIEKREVFQTKKPTKAADYLKKVRMGQTERGSYVITVISRVPPVLSLQESERLFEIDEPFERQVTTTLVKAVAAANNAASNAVSTGSFEGFKSAVKEGVSANLCDAIYGIASEGQTSRDLEVNFSWSVSRPVNDATIKSKITFLSDSMPVFKEAARLFRAITTTRDDFELRGQVVKLERAEGAPKGKVTIVGNVDEQPRNVIIDLEDNDYHKAVQAHDNQEIISCTGLLTREGRSYELHEPRNLRVDENT